MIPVDTTPPRLTLLGSGVRGISPLGEPVMLDDVPYGMAWTDPGVTASDVDAFGATLNLTTSVQRFGVAAVNTK